MSHQVVAAAGHEAMALSPLGYGLVAWGALMSLLIITLAFRHVSKRH